MDGRLFSAALRKFALGVVAVGALLFLPAGTLRWWQGWLLMAILFTAQIGTAVFAKKYTDRNEDTDE